MRSDPRKLDGQRFDLVVIGGGIHGAAFAREAVLRGARTLVIEREDFAAGTSSRSSRLVHGGVRYLEQGHLSLVREALGERERLLRLAPHLVRPLPMLMPFLGASWWSRQRARIGLWLYDRLAGGSSMPGSRRCSAADCLRLFPGLCSDGLRGGVLFWDAATRDAPLTVAVLEDAAAEGAVLCNHTELVEARGDGLVLRDLLANAEVTVRAGQVLNAAGPRVDHVRQRLGLEGPDLVRASRGSHLVLAPRNVETALAAFLPDGRIQFVVPHRDGTLCGTTEVEGDPGERDGDAPAEDVDYLLGALAQLFDRPPEAADIVATYAGWRALPTGRGPAGALNREAFLVPENAGVGRVHTIVGGKLTTHRSFAERGIGDILGSGSGTPSPTRERPLPGGDGLREPSDPLWWRWGSRAVALRAAAGHALDLLEPICPHRDLLALEVRHAFALGAMTFADVFERRLFDLRGPCAEPACRERQRELFVRFAAASGVIAGVDLVDAGAPPPPEAKA
ncbi:MAG: glycerol-3-phosphate dehydrogenase/oxidase [Planctomycetota bacterium]